MSDFTVQPLKQIDGLQAVIKDILMTDVRAIRQRNRNERLYRSIVANVAERLEVFAAEAGVHFLDRALTEKHAERIVNAVIVLQRGDQS